MTGALAVVLLTQAKDAGTADFYTPPSPLPPAAAGTVIRERPLQGAGALPSAGRNVLVLYHSRSSANNDVAVSGVVSIPKGAPPAGGWPVILWAHGTTGMAPMCAPSRDTAHGPEHAYLSGVDAMLDDYVRRGYAVVATDYAGLGTPGVHTYLLGVDEARSALDLLRAARHTDPHIGRRYVVMGHSQGGQAALFAAAVGANYAPELSLLGGVAFAPASHIADRILEISRQAQPTPILVFSLYALKAYAVSSGEARMEEFLTEDALAHLDELDEACFSRSASSGYWGAASPVQQFRQDFAPLQLAGFRKATEPERLTIHAPLFLAQGLNDSFVPATGTTELAKRYCGTGALDFRTYEGIDHVGVMQAAAADAATWIAARFQGLPPPTHCERAAH